MTDGDDMPWRRYRHIDPRRSYVHAVHTIGRRGLIFAALGVLWLMQSVVFVAAVHAAVLDGPTRVIYLTTAAIWAISGLAGIAGAVRPQGHDRLATVGLYVAPAAGVVIGSIRVGLWIAPNWTTGPAAAMGSLLGFVEVVGYGCLTVVVVAVAGWRENLPPRRGAHAKHR